MPRLDQHLVNTNHFESRAKAQQAIREGAVRVNGQVVTRPSEAVTDTDLIEVGAAESLRYVSRGGFKLERAIQAFGLDLSDKTVLDVGASTGGFTDCALQHGALHVYAVDVGNDQLHPALRAHPGVTSIEDQDLRTLRPEQLGGRAMDFIVIDVSFISLKHIFPHLRPFLRAGGQIVALIKPQFELEDRQHLKGGIVREEKLRQQVLRQVKEYAREAGFPFRDSGI